MPIIGYNEDGTPIRGTVREQLQNSDPSYPGPWEAYFLNNGPERNPRQIQQDTLNEEVPTPAAPPSPPTPGGGGGGGGGPAPTPGGGGGGGGTKAIPLPAQVTYKPEAQDTKLDYNIMQGIEDALNGTLAPFDAATIARMRAASFQAAQGQGQQARANLSADMTRRGLTRSGIAAEQGVNISNQTNAITSKGMRDVLVTAAQGNYQAKVDGLKRAQAYLDQRQQFALANIRTTQDYQIAQAQNSLAYARLQQEWRTTQAQLDNALRIAAMGSETQLLALYAQLAAGGSGL